jgi:hypothetical protein
MVLGKTRAATDRLTKILAIKKTLTTTKTTFIMSGKFSSLHFIL